MTTGALPGHGAAAPRGQAGARGGRFGRMFPDLPAAALGEPATAALVRLMNNPDERATSNTLPAGYTYLGQFIDHDITFDPTSSLMRANDPDALVNFRTPRFDLDSLYGSGPADQPYLYDWRRDDHPGVRLLSGQVAGAEPDVLDLPRNQGGRALTGDARNDEHLIIAQLHLLFLRFHNRVVDLLAARRRWGSHWDLFDAAQQTVRWHYQWIVMHDFLDRIVGPDMATSIRPAGAGGGIERRHYRYDGEPFIPVEFSGAAFRFGHSMVRNDYHVNAQSGLVPLFGDGDVPHLRGFRPLPPELVIDWRRFFWEPAAEAQLRTDQIPGMRIDRQLAERLFRLPPDGAALAELNLRRGRALGLPSGTEVARAMGVEPLTPAQLLLDEANAGETPPDVREALSAAPPLWYYILCEARDRRLGRGGQHLGPVGGRIVAEVLAGLLEGDPLSYHRQAPAWSPADEGLTDGGDFRMIDLVDFVER
jgi:hypothetical protein